MDVYKPEKRTRAGCDIGHRQRGKYCRAPCPKNMRRIRRYPEFCYSTARALRSLFEEGGALHGKEQTKKTSKSKVVAKAKIPIQSLLNTSPQRSSSQQAPPQQSKRTRKQTVRLISTI